MILSTNVGQKKRTNNIPERIRYPWITEGLVNCIMEKDRLQRMSVQDPVFRNDYIAYKKKIQKCIKITKAKCY